MAPNSYESSAVGAIESREPISGHIKKQLEAAGAGIGDAIHRLSWLLLSNNRDGKCIRVTVSGP